jgi:hypothetical protein
MTRLLTLASLLVFACNIQTSAPGGTGGNGGAPAGAAGTGFEALYKTGNGAPVPNVITGVWSGALSAESNPDFAFELRYDFRATEILAANRCTYKGATGPIAGVRLLARVNSGEIAFLEAKSDKQTKNGVTCSIAPPAATLSACPKDEQPLGCFKLAGTTLTLVGETEMTSVKLTKIRD